MSRYPSPLRVVAVITGAVLVIGLWTAFGGHVGAGTTVGLFLLWDVVRAFTTDGRPNDGISGAQGEGMRRPETVKASDTDSIAHPPFFMPQTRPEATYLTHVGDRNE
jgi:hypothetical protein